MGRGGAEVEAPAEAEQPAEAPPAEDAGKAEKAEDGGAPPEGAPPAEEGVPAEGEGAAAAEGGGEAKPDEGATPGGDAEAKPEGEGVPAEGGGEGAVAPAAADGEAAGGGEAGGAPAAPAAPPAKAAPALPTVDPSTIELPEGTPLGYVVGEDGGKEPLPGVESVFLTGTTLKLVGLEEKPAAGFLPIAKEVLMHDIQFRGAISDFHPIKAKIQKSDYDPLIVRWNDDDIYGDGNNFEVCCKQSAADEWQAIIDAKAAAIAAAEAAILAAAEEKAAKKKKKKSGKREAKEWASLGSEVEIEEATVRPTRERIQMTICRRRREFNQPVKLSDKDSQELWNSSWMECRPERNPNFELKRMEFDVGVQAVPELRPVEVQATNNPPRNGSTQYEALAMSEEDRVETLRRPEMKEFLSRITPLYEEALQQNEVADVFEDEFGALAEDDSAPGHKSANVVKEYQSFTHLIYSKNKRVSAIHWVPGRKGVVAVACTEPLSFNDRVDVAGRVRNSYILVWNFKDPIHPQYVLESPVDIFSFQFNPTRTDLVAGGGYNGQVVLWDMSTEQDKLQRKGKESEGEDDDATIPVVKHQHLSVIESGHNKCVTDLCWLSGAMEVDRRSKLTENPDGQTNMFATVACDGKVLFWDIRMKRDPKKPEILWTPTYGISLTNPLIGGDLGAIRFAFGDLRKGNGPGSRLLLTSQDGEVTWADFDRPEGVEHPDFVKHVADAQYGPVVALQRSPFFEDVLLSVGDWTFNIWREGKTTPIFTSSCSDTYLTDGRWSPSRAAVIYLAKQDGMLEVWDLLDRSHEPSMLATISSQPLTSLSFWQHAMPQLMAVGDSQGVTHIMEVPRNLRRPVHREQEAMQAFLDREGLRLEYMEGRAVVRAAERKEKEALAAKEAEEKVEREAKGEATPVKAAEPVAAMPQYDDKMEQEYLKLELEFKAEMGLLPVEEED